MEAADPTTLTEALTLHRGSSEAPDLRRQASPAPP
jgi:hypothetical protein